MPAATTRSCTACRLHAANSLRYDTPAVVPGVLAGEVLDIRSLSESMT